MQKAVYYMGIEIIQKYQRLVEENIRYSKIAGQNNTKC